MKKITLMLLMVFSSLAGYAQLASEGFEGSWPPTGWSVENVAGPIQTWQQAANNNAQPSHNGDFSAFVSTEIVAEGTTTEDWLITAPFNVPTNGQLRFFSRLTQPGDQNTKYQVYINNNPATFNDISAYTSLIAQPWGELDINPDQLVYNERVVQIPSSYTGTQARIAFVMRGNNGDRWLVDDVSVVERCFDPTGVQVTNITTNSASINWSGTASSWEIEIIPSNQTPTGNGVPFAGPPPYIATDLVEGEEYQVLVKAICATGQGSNQTKAVLFDVLVTGESCTAPINIANLPYGSGLDNTENYGSFYDGTTGSGCGTETWEYYFGGNQAVYAYTAAFTGNITIDLKDTNTYSGVFVYANCADIGKNCLAGANTGWQNSQATIQQVAVTEGSTYYIVVTSQWGTIPYQLVVQEFTCAPPVGLETTNIGLTSANLSWTNPTGATSWQVAVQPLDTGIPQGAGETANTNTNYLADGLEEGTAYEYYVRAACGDGRFSQWAGPYPFNTSVCEASEKCDYTFTMTDEFGDGWNGNAISVIQNGLTVASVTLEEGEGPTEYTVALCTGIPFELFWGTEGNYPQEVGFSVKNSFGQTLYTYEAGSGEPQTTLYTGTANCTEPACLSPEVYTTISTDLTSATIGWEGAETGTWEYYVLEEGDEVPPAEASGIPFTTNPITLTDLPQGTNLVLYVKTICGTTSTDWGSGYPFSTKICAPENQCDYTFTMTSTSWSGGWDGAEMVIKQDGVNVATIGPEFTEGSEMNVTIPLCTDTPFEVFYTEAGDSYWSVGLTITNKFEQKLFDLAPGSVTPPVEIFTGFADCNNPACVAPTGLTVSDITMTSATIGWDGLETGSWNYVILPAGSPAPTADTEGTDTTTNPTTDNTLTAATNYEYYVRINCQDGAHSEWAGPIPFSTEVCADEEKCTFSFVMTNTQGNGWGGYTATIYQAGTPITTIGSNFTWGNSQTVEIALCPNVQTDIVLDEGGWSLNGIGLQVLTPFLEDFALLNTADFVPGTTIHTGITSCDPPACPRPQDLTHVDVTLTTATLGWTEMATATEWEVIVLPFGSDVPADDAEGETVTDVASYLAENLTPGTPYVFYVRAICGGENGSSSWAGPHSFVTAVPNDECATAITAPVNTGADCVSSISGTLTGATGSDMQPSCNEWADIQEDVWYSFTATSNTHIIEISNQENVTAYFTVYGGSGCGSLDEVYCAEYTNLASVSGLTPGQKYYVMIYASYISNDEIPTSFDLCISTPSVVNIDTTTHTVPELVTDILVGNTCASVSNISWSTGGDSNNLTTGIAMFTKGNSNFGINEGVVLVTGEAANAVGPNLTTDSTGGWDGDDDLFNYIEQSGIDPALMQYNDASVLEFDFVPLSTQMRFPFIFASEEYGGFQCSFSDAFAFFLTDESGNTTNLAVVPETNDPVSVLTIRNGLYNSGCDSVNEEYFAGYYAADGMGLPAGSAPINYNGFTIRMFAESTVVPGQTYHIKLVIADRNDTSLNSAVFIGQFDIGKLDLGVDLTVNDGTALCQGESATLNTQLDPEDYTFEWFRNDELIAGETGPSLTVTEEGNYSVVASHAESACETSDAVLVEFYDDLNEIIGKPEDLTECSDNGYASFTLTDASAGALGTLSPEHFTVTFYESEADAQNQEDELESPYTNTVIDQQTIYVRVQANNGNCNAITSFNIIVNEPAEFTVTPDVNKCEGTSTVLAVTPVNFNAADATYAWSNGTATLPGTTAEISVTDPGTYTVTVTYNGCDFTDTVVVTDTPAPTPDDIADVVSCNQYVLPALSANNTYYTETNGGGTQLNEGALITATQEIFVRATNAGTPECFAETSFIVTITPPPTVVAPEDVTACDTYELPALTQGNYFTATNGGGTQLNEGDTISETQTIFVYYAPAVGCEGEDSFIVTIVPTPTPVAPANATACSTYELPALAAGNSYYTEPNGAGAQLFAGDAITTTTTLYVRAVSATGNCAAEVPFVVTIATPPTLEPVEDLTVCQSYTLPALTTGGYFTATGGTGTAIPAGTAITATQTVFVYAVTPEGCSSEESFEVTVAPAIVADAPADVNECGSYTLPELASGNYFTAAGGTGTQIAAGSVIITSQTIFVYATNGACSDENSFTVNLSPAPLLDLDTPITGECDQMNFVITANFDADEDIYTPDNVTYTWKNQNEQVIGQGQSVIIENAGTYTVTVAPIGNPGCSTTESATFTDVSCAIQKGISPGGTADQNDTFDLSNLDVRKLTIFNRYGKEVYTYNGAYTNQWGGQDSKGGELPNGTYFYMFERSNGESKTG